MTKIVKAQEILTSDLGKFGWVELNQVQQIVIAMMEHGLPENFENEEVQIVFNRNSGYVFLTNSEYQVAMLNGSKLELFYTCPICGHEGFLENMRHNEDGAVADDECIEYAQSIGAV